MSSFKRAAALFFVVFIFLCYALAVLVIATGGDNEVFRFVAWCCFGFSVGFLIGEFGRYKE